MRMCEWKTNKVQMSKVRIHGANACIKYECVNIKTGLNENPKIVHTYRAESVLQTCQTMTSLAAFGRL